MTRATRSGEKILHIETITTKGSKFSPLQAGSRIGLVYATVLIQRFRIKFVHNFGLLILLRGFLCNFGIELWYTEGASLIRSQLTSVRRHPPNKRTRIELIHLSLSFMTWYACANDSKRKRNLMGSDMEAWLSKVTLVTWYNMAETKCRDALFTYVVLLIFIFNNYFNDSRNLPIGRNQSRKNKFYRGRECVKEMIILIKRSKLFRLISNIT